MDEQEFTEIDRLLDGSLDAELDAAQERELYGRLAADEELRSSLHDMQAVRSATLNYHGAIVPPAELTGALFARLGITRPPAAMPPGPAAPAAGPAFLAMLHRLRTLLLGIAVLGGSALLYLLSQPGADTGGTVTSGPTTPPSATSEPATPSSATSEPATPSGPSKEPAASSFAAGERPSAVPEQTQPVIPAGGSADREAGGTPPPAAIDTAGQNTEQFAVPSAGQLPLPARPPRFPDIQPAPAEPLGGETPLIVQFDGPGAGRAATLPAGFSVLCRGFSRAAWPSATVDPKSSPFLRNMAVGLRYSLDDEHAIGLEVAQETFPQHYEGTENGARVRIEQNLLTQWLTAQYHYRPTSLALFRGAYPFLALNAGVTAERWPLLRSTVGLQYAPWRGMSVMLGAEGALLLYPFQDVWNATRSIGVTYGVAVEF